MMRVLDLVMIQIKITVVDCSGKVTPYKLKKKDEVANDVFKHIIELM